MIIRSLTFIGALASGASLSQFPEYSQQYQQRLAGAVDEMRVVVQQFDDSLETVGKTRAEVFLAEPASDLEGQLIEDGKSNIARLTYLETALAKIKNAPVLDRFLATPSVADGKVAAAAWRDFQPALPLSVVGLAFAGVGFIGGWFIFAAGLGLLAWLGTTLFRRKTEA